MTRWMTRTLALLTAVGLLCTAQPASAVAFTPHSGHYWTWMGPRTWHASYGAYGITVSSPSGLDVLDLGFSSTVCSNGRDYAHSVSNHFAALRRQYNQGAYHIVSNSRVVHPANTGTNYRRQTLQMRIISGGTTYKGVFVFDYDYQTTVSSGASTVNYCYQRSLAMYAPRSRFDASTHQTLIRIFGSLGYSGPGVPHKREDPTI